MNRPELTEKLSLEDFTGFYWLEQELTAFCRIIGINSTGGKIEIANRIKTFLETGDVSNLKTGINKQATSNFDWNKELLSLNTVITDNYKSTENVRTFFVTHIGSHFRFTVDFMKWAKQNEGKTLAEAIAEWNRQKDIKKDKSFKTDIAPQFEYNRYMRAFLADNPGKTTKDAMKFWKLKRALRGDNNYSKSDLLLSTS